MTQKQIEAMKARIATYVARITTRLAEEATANTTGDCWDCSMYVQGDGRSMGDYNGHHDHLLLHIQQRYYPGTLLVNAWKEKVGDTAGQPTNIGEVQRAVQSYMEKRLIA
jgi:hypothetical protein